MALAGNVDVSATLETSVFNMKLKEVAKGLKETFSLDSRQATDLAKLEQTLRKQAETFGMTSNEIAIYKLEQQGVSAAALRTARSLDQQIKSLHEQEKAAEQASNALSSVFKRGQSTYDSTRTATEKYRLKVAQLKEELKEGAINQDTFNRAMADLKPAKVKGNGLFGMGGPSAMQGIAAGIAGLGAAAIGAGAGFVYLGAEQQKVIDRAGDLAGKLGVSVPALTGMQQAFRMLGAEEADVGPVFTKMSKTIADSAAGSLESGKKFRDLGLDVQNLANLKADQQFLAIAGSLSKIKNQTDLNKAAFDIFGKQAMTAMNVLKAGPEAIQKELADAQKRWQVFTDEEASAAGRFNDALDNIGRSFNGLIGKVFGALSPIVSQLSEDFLNWATETISVEKIVEGAFFAIEKAVVYAADSFQYLKGAWYNAQAYVSKGIGVLLDAMQNIAKGIDMVRSYWTGQQSTFAKQLEGMSKPFYDFANEQWDKSLNELGKAPTNDIHEWFKKVRGYADKATEGVKGLTDAERDQAEKSQALIGSIEDLKKKYMDEIRFTGLTSDQMEVLKLKEQGATAAQIAEVKALADQTRALGKAKDLIEGLKTPFDLYKEKMKGLEIAWKNGIIKTQQEYEKAKALAGKEFLGTSSTKFAAATDIYSKEGRSQLLAASQGRTKMDDGIINIQANTGKQVIQLGELNAQMRTMLSKLGRPEVLSIK